MTLADLVQTDPWLVAVVVVTFVLVVVLVIRRG